MNISEITQEINKIPQEQREAVSNLIDLKTNENMEKVIQEIRRLEDKFDNKFSAMEGKFDAKFEAVDSKFSTIFWILGIMAKIILAILGLLLKNG